MDVHNKYCCAKIPNSLDSSPPVERPFELFETSTTLQSVIGNRQAESGVAARTRVL